MCNCDIQCLKYDWKFKTSQHVNKHCVCVWQRLITKCIISLKPLFLEVSCIHRIEMPVAERRRGNDAPLIYIAVTAYNTLHTNRNYLKHANKPKMQWQANAPKSIRTTCTFAGAAYETKRFSYVPITQFGSSPLSPLHPIITHKQ